MFDFLTEKFSSVFSSLTGKNKLTEQNLSVVLDQIKDSLLESDVPYSSVQTFVDGIKNEVVGQKVTASLRPDEQFIKIVYDRMLSFLGGAYLQEGFNFQIPSVIMVMGLQGSGKTTSIGKLAYFIKRQAEKHGKVRKMLFASVDFYRPAAIDQLEILAHQVGADFYRSTEVDPIAAAKDIVQHYKKQGYEYLMFDTAGRLQIDQSMMLELQAIKKIMQPKYSFMVLDAMTGQESLVAAKAFADTVNLKAALVLMVQFYQKWIAVLVVVLRFHFVSN